MSETALTSGSIDLASFRHALWNELKRATDDPQHDWRLIQLATTDSGRPRLRTVVLRDADTLRCELVAHTDRRSAKIQEIRSNPYVEWLAYDRESRTQVILSGTAEVHLDDDLADRAWERTPPEQLRLYCAPHPPGEVSKEASHNLPEDLINRVPTSEELESARQNFAVIRGIIEEVDVLTLNRHGNLRAHFARKSDWQGQWIQP